MALSGQVYQARPSFPSDEARTKVELLRVFHRRTTSFKEVLKLQLRAHISREMQGDVFGEVLVEGGRYVEAAGVDAKRGV